MKSNLLRIKERSDAKQETIENRTVVVGNIPPWFNKNEILNALTKFGSIIKIDMPMTDNRVEEIINNLPNISNENKLQHSYEERIKAAEKYFGLIDEHYKFQSTDDSKAYPVFEHTLESQTSTLAERIVNYEKELQKRVSSKSTVHVEKTLSNIRGDSENLKLINSDKKMKVTTL
jgi:RNA recognition motif-containing protein